MGASLVVAIASLGKCSRMEKGDPFLREAHIVGCSQGMQLIREQAYDEARYQENCITH